jgi:hypothetical protein
MAQTITFDVFLVDSTDIQLTAGENKKHPRGPQIVICDYGIGPCIEFDTINNPVYSVWFTLLNNHNPIASRTSHTVTLDEDGNMIDNEDEQ